MEDVLATVNLSQVVVHNAANGEILGDISNTTGPIPVVLDVHIGTEWK
jgi:hypothetical protein